MKKIVLAVIMLCGVSAAYAQKYMTRTGKITFYSATPLENIEAINNEVACVMNGENGEFIFQVPVKSFKFERSLMEEHFNENYMESSKYPRSKFKGKIDNFDSVNLEKDGTYEVEVSGTLEIHGVTNPIKTKGTLKVQGDTINANSAFTIAVADYGIEIPKVVKDNVAKEVEISVNVVYKPFKR